VKLRAVEVLADLVAGGPVESDGCTRDVVFDGVTTDSRQDVRGRLFVALSGDRFDAHAFVPDALAGGAAGVLVRRDMLSTLPAGPGARIGVADPLRALQALAHASLARRPVRVIAVTGSNGKTTTKDLVAAALATRGRVHATRGNLNNHIGVPLTVLARTGDEDFLVAEAGASDFGELELLSRLLEPHVAVITNIGRAHLERFESRQGVARAKGEILAALRPDGRAVLNADDDFYATLVARAGGAARVASFGFAPDAAYRIEAQRPLDAGRQELTVRGVRFVLPRPGRGHAANAAAALAVADLCGADLAVAAAAFEHATFTAGRSAWSRVGDLDVLDDSYNANPDSMALALETLAAAPGRRIAVLGDMLELGADAAALHAQIGAQAAAAGVDYLFGYGPAMAHAVDAAARAGLGTRARHFDDHAALATALREVARPGDAVLVKGSRGSRMETVIAALAAGVA
jgi:UDP-N-acetylmuramoyl-tripeptide--D-alanyl-D-alanine ligase